MHLCLSSFLAGKGSHLGQKAVKMFLMRCALDLMCVFYDD